MGVGRCLGKEIKKALMIASMASMLDNFNKNNIRLLYQAGYEITLAANFKTEDSNSRNQVQEFKNWMEQNGFHIVHIDFSRKVFNWKGQIQSFMQVKRIAEKEFDLVHCHSPICAAMTRIAFRKKRKQGTKVIYTAHGFHFYKGAPIINWLIYFPVEWICANFTDVLLTINLEDYKRARKWFKAKKIEYIPGVGVDVNKFQDTSIGRETERKKLGLKDSDIMLLSVGELNKNKNHEVVIKAVGKMDAGISHHIHYFIAGKGELHYKLIKLASELGVNLHLLGFRRDIPELLRAADIFLLPSIREGLNVSLMEAMASGLPCIASDIRGNVDLIDEKRNGQVNNNTNIGGGFLFDPVSVKSVQKTIEKLLSFSDDERKAMGYYNYRKIQKFDKCLVEKDISRIYDECIH